MTTPDKAGLVEHLRKALKGADDLDNWHRHGEGYGLLRKEVEAAEAKAVDLERERDALRHATEFTAKMAWRTDPPNASNKLTDGERLSAIKFHPTIKAFGQPHIELAEREAAALSGRDKP